MGPKPCWISEIAGYVNPSIIITIIIIQCHTVHMYSVHVGHNIIVRRLRYHMINMNQVLVASNLQNV